MTKRKGRIFIASSTGKDLYRRNGHYTKHHIKLQGQFKRRFIALIRDLRKAGAPWRDLERFASQCISYEALWYRLLKDKR